MQTQWTFRYETRGFHFDKERTFEVAQKEDQDLSLLGREPRFATLKVVPDSSSSPEPPIDQVGDLIVTAQGRPEETRDFALLSARHLAERMTFQFGDFRLRIVMLLWRRIPETDDERLEVGDRPCGAMFEIEEIVATPSYDPVTFSNLAAQDPDFSLLSVFNASTRSDDPVQRFLGYYRILESLCHVRGDRKAARTVLLSNAALRRLYPRTSADKPFADFIDRLVAVRNECAHLRLPSDYGYVPHDVRVRDEVLPLLEHLAELVRLALVNGKDFRAA